MKETFWFGISISGGCLAHWVEPSSESRSSSPQLHSRDDHCSLSAPTSKYSGNVSRSILDYALGVLCWNWKTLSRNVLWVTNVNDSSFASAIVLMEKYSNVECVRVSSYHPTLPENLDDYRM
ncbi:hypothetical protein C8R42DRAFT_9619 [Lentinula raphanica]|nr:hypothetical protein C8R42DRAFT_9619 [Lentinula raphanica]